MTADQSEMANPEIPLREAGEPSASRYDELARSYLKAAHRVWDNVERHEFGEFAAPCLTLLGHSPELFLKGRLMERGCTPAVLRKEYGHDIHGMWTLPQFDDMRAHAQKFAVNYAKADPSRIPDPSKFTVDWTVKYLSDLYTARTGYALRYPASDTQVPDPGVLILVMAELIDDPAWGTNT